MVELVEENPNRGRADNQNLASTSTLLTFRKGDYYY